MNIDLKQLGADIAAQFEGLQGRHPGLWPLAPRLLCAAGVMAAVLGLAAPAMQQALGGIPAFLLLFAGTMAISVPLAALTYRFVEKPFIRIGRGIRLPARQLSPA